MSAEAKQNTSLIIVAAFVAGILVSLLGYSVSGINSEDISSPDAATAASVKKGAGSETTGSDSGKDASQSTSGEEPADSETPAADPDEPTSDQDEPAAEPDDSEQSSGSGGGAPGYGQ